MHKKITFIFALLSLLVVGTVQAQAAVPAVTDIEATYENGAVKVEWKPVATQGIKSYRVYYSRESILENNGDYDDFEETDGPVREFLFDEPPYRNVTLFVSVLAVDQAGNESEGFAEEASVLIPAADTSASSSSESSASSSESSASSDVSTGQPLVMTHALTYSPTELSVFFTKTLQQTTIYPQNIVIIDSHGQRLMVSAAVMQGNAIRLTTSAQSAGDAYTVASVGEIRSTEGDAVNPSVNQIVFQGHPTGASSSYTQPPAGSGASSSSSSTGVIVDVTPPEDARNLQLKYVVQPDGTYVVDAKWDPSMNTAGDLATYEVRSTHDGIAAGFGQLPFNKHTAQYQGIRPGLFTVMVRAGDHVGNFSQGILESVRLPETGLGLLGLMLASGALTGSRALKKKSGRA